MINKKNIINSFLIPISILSLIIFLISLKIYFQNNGKIVKIETKKNKIIKSEINKNPKEKEIDKAKNNEKSQTIINNDPLKNLIISNSPIYFIEDTVILKENEINKLVNISKGFNGYNKIELEINGHADSVGKPEEEFTLSLHRAEFVKDYILKENSNVLFVFKIGSFGSSCMVYTGDDLEKRYLNRRVEIELLYAIK